MEGDVYGEEVEHEAHRGVRGVTILFVCERLLRITFNIQLPQNGLKGPLNILLVLTMLEIDAI